MTISLVPQSVVFFMAAPNKLIHDFIPLMLSQLLEYLEWGKEN